MISAKDIFSEIDYKYPNIPRAYFANKDVQLLYDFYNQRLDIINAVKIVWPRTLTVNGNLDLYLSCVENWPSKLYVEGDLNMFDAIVHYLPNNLIIKGHLNICRTAIKILPEDISVKRIIISRKQLTYAPAHVRHLIHEY